MLTSPLDRRQKIRRISDSCSQCEIWTLKIAEIEKQASEYKAEFTKSISSLQSRINQNLSWRVFIVIIGLYLGLATYNAIAIKNLSIDAGRLATKIDSINEKIIDLKMHFRNRD